MEITNQWGFNGQNIWEVITTQPGIGSGCNLWLTSDKSYTRIKRTVPPDVISWLVYEAHEYYTYIYIVKMVIKL